MLEARKYFKEDGDASLKEQWRTVWTISHSDKQLIDMPFNLQPYTRELNKYFSVCTTAVDILP